MKRILALFILFFALVSCEKENSASLVSESALESENLITEQEALDKVISQMSIFDNDGSATTKSKKYELLSSETIKPRTKSANNSPLYLFTFKDNNGYALISADIRDNNCIYLISTEGYMDSNFLYDESSPYNFIYKCINRYQSYVIGNYENTPKTKAKEEEVVVTKTVTTYGSYLSTQWEQGNPFNQTVKYNLHDIFGPLSIYNVGCAPVAIGQIFAHDTTISTISYVKNPNNIISFNMNDIRKIKNKRDAEDDNDYNGGTLTNQVADFLYYIGEAIGTYYEYSNSSGEVEGYTHQTEDVANGIRKFGFTCANFIDYDVDIVKECLMTNTPVLANGYGNNGSNGHTWVIDVYKVIKEEHRTYDENGNLLVNDELNDYVFDITNKYFHCNFGWLNGKSNGDYHISYELDVQGWPGRTFIYSNIFNSDNVYHYDIEPKEFAYINVEVMCGIRYNHH